MDDASTILCAFCHAKLPAPAPEDAEVQCPSCDHWNTVNLPPHDGEDNDPDQTIVKPRPPQDPDRTIVSPIPPKASASTGAADRTRVARPARRRKGPDLTGQLLGGTYEITDFVAQGGMGSIWKAHDRSLNRDVAIKVLLQDEDADPANTPEFLARFRVEAQTLARVCDHANLVRIFGFSEHRVDGESAGFPYMVMEYVTGPAGAPLTIAQRIADRDLPVEEAVDLFLETCAAVEHVHSHPVWHRDVKPANVLIDRHGHARLTDFGIARREGGGRTSGAVTQENAFLGAYNYMSPEQKADPTTVDARSDVYSLGVTFFEMLTGRPPEGHGWSVPAKVGPAAARFDAVIKKAVAHRPDDRYPSARALADAVRAAVAPPQRSFGKPKISRWAMVGATALALALGVYFVSRPPTSNGKGTITTDNDKIAPLPIPTLADLVKAINAEDRARVEAILYRAPETAKQRDATGKTALHVAAALRNVEVFNAVLAKGSDVDATDNAGRTPLHYAAEAGQESAVATLVVRTKDATSADLAGKTPSQLARDNGHAQLADVLSGLAPFRTALSNKNYRGGPDSAEQLLTRNPSLVKAPFDKSGLTALQVMSQAGDAAAVELLLEKGANPNALDSEGRNALMLAVANDDVRTGTHLPLVKALLAAPSGKDAARVTDGAKRTPLHVAAARGDVEAVKLLKPFSDLAARDAASRTPLAAAAEAGSAEVVQFLLPDYVSRDPAERADAARRAGSKYPQVAASIEKTMPAPRPKPAPALEDGAGGKAFLASVLGGDAKAVKTALDKDPTLIENFGLWAGKEGENVLHYLAANTARCGNVAGIEEVVAVVASRDAKFVSRPRKSDQMTPLHLAGADTLDANKALLVSLVKHGADLAAKNGQGKTALESVSVVEWQGELRALRATPRPLPEVQAGAMNGKAPGALLVKHLQVPSKYDATVNGQDWSLTRTKDAVNGVCEFRVLNGNSVRCTFEANGSITFESEVPLFGLEAAPAARGGTYRYRYTGDWEETNAEGNRLMKFRFRPAGASEPIEFKGRR